MRNSVHGTPEQFEAALENRIAQLTGNTVNSSTIKSTSFYETDEQYKERYIHALIGDVDSKISRYVDSIKFEYDDSNIIITIGIDGTIKEYTVPYSDLQFEWDYIDDDTSYIIDEIRYDLDIYHKNIDSSIVTGAYEKNDNPQDFVNYVDPVLEKLGSVGCDIHDDEVIDYAEAAAELIANDDDHDVDYWWEATQSDDMYMDEINALPHYEVDDERPL